MSYNIRTKDFSSWIRSVVPVTILLLATFVFIPRLSEPCAETWKQWAAARILGETGGFPVFSMGPAYVVYLQLFRLFDFPLALQIEHSITCLFTNIAIFWMLRAILPRSLALLLTCAWNPAVFSLEPGGAIAGIGCMALYFGSSLRSVSNKGYLSSSLLAAALCHSAYAPFWAGHMIGVFIKRYVTKQRLFSFSCSMKQIKIFPLLLKAGLILVIILTIFSTSHRLDNNHLMEDSTYVPVSLKNPISVAFFQIGSGKYMRRTLPKSSWIDQDWYFIHGKAFGEATTIFQAFLRRPGVVAANILENLCNLTYLPMYFITGNLDSPVKAVSWILFPIGLIGMMRRFKESGKMPLIFSITLGSLSVIVALLLSHVSERYMMLLLPVMLLLVSHIGSESWHLAKSLSTNFSMQKFRPLLSARPRKEQVCLVLGYLLVFSGIIFNEWTLSLLFTDILSIVPRVKILSVAIFLIMSGIVLILSILCRSAFVSERAYKGFSYSRAAGVMISAILVFLMAVYPQGGKIKQIKAALSAQPLLFDNMAMASPELLSSINKKTTVLASDDIWLKAFTDIDLDRIYGIFNLPPFVDTSGKTEQMFSRLDAVWISFSLLEARPRLSVQPFLRYRLHVKPFLEKALASGWTVREVKGYGKIYQRPTSKKGQRE